MSPSRRAAQINDSATGEPGQRVAVLDVNAALEGKPGQGAIHHARIDEAIAQVARQSQAYGCLTGSNRPINGDYGCRNCLTR